MIEALVQIFTGLEDYILPFFLVLSRVSAAMAALPAFGEQMLPARIKLMLAFALSAIVFPPVSSDLEAVAEGSFMLLLLQEIVIGLTIGISLRLHVMSLQIAATIAAQSTSLAQLLGANGVDPQPAIGVILYVSALALAVEFGLHIQFAVMFISSYGTVPVGAVDGSVLPQTILNAVSHAFEFGFIISAPFVVASLLFNLALGVINRAMPQLMVAFVGAPAITYGSLVLLALTAPLMLSLWVEHMQDRIYAPFGPW